MAPDLRRRVDLARAAREAREGEMKRQVDAQVRLHLVPFPSPCGVKARGVDTNADADACARCALITGRHRQRARQPQADLGRAACAEVRQRRGVRKAGCGEVRYFGRRVAVIRQETAYGLDLIDALRVVSFSVFYFLFVLAGWLGVACLALKYLCPTRVDTCAGAVSI